MDGSTRLDDRVVPLTEVLTTAELGRRSLRPPDFEVENRALVALADELASSPETLLQSLIETAFELCRAESTGISVREAGEGRGRFRWNAMAGPFASHLGETTSRDGSPCGTVLDRDAALLIERPARHFTELRGTQPEPVEALLVPFTSRTSRSARFGRSGIRTNAGSRRKMRDSSDDGWVSVDVRDPGPGIAPGQRDRIFEAFTQLVGEGSTFTLRLPRRGRVLSAAAQPPA